MSVEKDKRIGRFFGWVFLSIAVFLSRIIPYKLVCFFGVLFGRLASIFAIKHIKIGREALNIAFPQKSQKEKNQILRRSFEHLGIVGWETLSFVFKKHLLDNLVEVRGLDNLKQALAKNKGVIGVSAHFGNFPLIPLKLNRLGFEINVMARPMRHRQSGDIIHNLRETTGVKTIFSYPRNSAVFNSLKALKRKEILIMHMDQNFGTGGVWVKFFNKLAATPIGPIVFAMRTQAAVVPMFVIRENGRNVVYIEKEYILIEKEDKDEAVLDNVIGITNIIEGWVRKYPDQWGWIHRRWKSRPTEKIMSQRFKVQKD